MNIIYKVIIASMVMGGFIGYFRDLNLFILVFIATIIYFGLIVIIKGFDKNDIKLLESLFTRKEGGRGDL